MPLQGACLALRFGITNNEGVISNELPRGQNIAAPTPADVESEVDALFGGQVVKMSFVRYRLTESEKAALLTLCVPRFSTRDVAGTFGSMNDQSAGYGFFIPNLGSKVTAADVEAFIKANCKLPDGTAPDRVFVGAPKLRA